MKIALLGYSGSGKSTTAAILSAEYGIPVLHLDTVQFMENWQERPAEQSKAIVADFMAANDSWVIDGNYKAFHQRQRLQQADMIIFFSFNRFTCFCRAFGRYLKYRGKTRPSMSAGCNEKFDLEFAKWILWDGRTPRRRKAYANMCEKYKDKVVIIRNQRQLDSFLNNIKVFQKKC